MLANVCNVLLIAAVVVGKQDVGLHKSQGTIKDQDVANDQVTSILVQPGPNGPRHVVLASDHQVIHEKDESPPFRSSHFRYGDDDVGFPHTAPPPRQHITYGPARPVAFHPQPLYHQGFAFGPAKGKIPYLKDDRKRLSDAIYKYSTYVNHAKIANLNKEELDDQGYYSGEADSPDYSVTHESRGSYRQPEGLSAYRNPQHEDDEQKYKESIGDVYENDYEKNSGYSPEKRTKPLPFSKLFFKKQHAYIPVKLNDNKYPLNNYQSSFNEEPYNDAPSGFDDKNGGKVTPILARFYKQPLPVIQTRLPIDNVGGLYFQYYPIYRSSQEKEAFSNHFDERYPEERSDSGSLESSESEWTPINAPAGAVPARGYDAPAPNLSRTSSSTTNTPALTRPKSVTNSVVVGKIKTPSQHIQSNSEGVVSAVVRVKQ